MRSKGAYGTSVGIGVARVVWVRPREVALRPQRGEGSGSPPPPQDVFRALEKLQDPGHCCIEAGALPKEGGCCPSPTQRRGWGEALEGQLGELEGMKTGGGRERPQRGPPAPCQPWSGSSRLSRGLEGLGLPAHLCFRPDLGAPISNLRTWGKMSGWRMGSQE